MKTSLQKTFCAAAAALALYGGQAHADFITVGTATENRIMTDTRWTRDNVYILARVIFVANGATLTIEPGTVIRGIPASLSGLSEEPGTLIVSRSGKIVANGTVDAPIIFTTIDDPNVPGGLNTVPDTFTNIPGTEYQIKGAGRATELTFNNYDPDGEEGDNGFCKSGDWGGVILCGRGYVSQHMGVVPRGGGANRVDANTDGIWDDHAASLSESPTLTQNDGVGTDFPEGTAPTLDGTGSNILNSVLALYGGSDDAHDCGVMRYTVNRYGGFVLGDPAAGNEINALTLCAIGSATTLEHNESFQNKDDGFEFFGGKANTRFLFSIANQDDSFDGDEGHRGNHQFWTAIQGTINTAGGSLRSGYTFNQRVGQVETATDYQYDKLMEWDGGEPNDGDGLPLTDLKVFNFTYLAGGTKKEGLQPRLETQLGMHNGIIENSTTISRAANTAGGLFTTMLTWSNIYTFNTSLNAGSLVVQNSAVGSTSGSSVTILTQLNDLLPRATSHIKTPWTFSADATVPVPCPLYTKHGLDPTQAVDSPARDVAFLGEVVLPSGIINTGFAGSMRDNDQMFGWSTLNYLQVLPTTNITRPVLTLGESAGNHTVSFPTVSADIKYVIEKSTDGRVWTVLTTVPVSDATTVSYTDTTTPVSERVLYRAYGL